MPKTHRSYTVEQKLISLRQLREEYGGNISLASRELGIDQKRIREWRDKESSLVGATDKKRRRACGSGCKAKFPEVEERLYRWFLTQREKRLNVNYHRVQEEAHKIREELEIDKENFVCSNKWIWGFCKRHSITSRRITHHGQEDKRDAVYVKRTVEDYLLAVQHLTADLDSAHIFNMDETPVYVDMTGGCTLDFKGARSVNALHTGHDKTRFTVVICYSMAGHLLQTMIIFKNLKKVPKCRVPRGIFVAVSPGGSMKEELMLSWLKNVFSARGSFFATEKSLLLLDSHHSHLHQSVKEHSRRMGVELKIIPPKTTSYLQPVDVGFNGPFKAAMRRKWQHWLEFGTKEYTAKGYRKRPSYEEVLAMVAEALQDVRPATMTRSFEASGVAELGAQVPSERLNERLAKVLHLAEEESMNSSSEGDPFSSDDDANSDEDDATDDEN